MASSVENPPGGSRPGAPSPRAASVRATPETTQDAPPRQDIFGGLWQGMQRSAALLAPLTLLLLLAVAAMLLPQMPGQLNYEPATAERWRLATSDTGPLGTLWHALGLYNVLFHPALKLILVFIVLVLAVRLAAALAAYRVVHTWHRQAHAPVEQPAEPVFLHNRGLYLHRRRWVLDDSPRAIHAHIAARLARIKDEGIAVEAWQRPYTTPESPAQGPNADNHRDTPFDTLAEQRYLLAANLHSLWGPILRELGLLVAVLAVWYFIVFGWSFTTPVLAPGDTFQSAIHELAIDYPLARGTDGAADGTETFVAISGARLGDEYRVPARDPRRAWGDYLLRVDAAAPAIVLSVAEGGIDLRRLAQAETGSALGITLEEESGEDTILLPEINAGMRIVRRSPNEPWLVEYYGAGDLQPRARWDVDPAAPSSFELPDQPVTLASRPAAGLRLQVNYMPAHRLLWVGLALTLISLGLLVRPAFFSLIQIAPWPTGSVLIVQTTSLQRLAQTHILSAMLTAQTPDAAAPKNTPHVAQP